MLLLELADTARVRNAYSEGPAYETSYNGAFKSNICNLHDAFRDQETSIQLLANPAFPSTQPFYQFVSRNLFPHKDAHDIDPKKHPRYPCTLS